MDSKLLKNAAEAIKTLRAENEKLAEDFTKRDTAVNLMFKLYKHGNVSAENLEALYNDLCNKSKPELEILEKAAELSIDIDTFKFGIIGEKPDSSGYDPLTACLLEDY